jgi:hypothetical protein
VANRADNFNRSNSAVSIGSPSDGGSAYAGSLGTAGIDSNQAYFPNAGTTGLGAVRVLDAGNADAEVEFTIVVRDNYFLVVLRWEDDNNYDTLFCDQNGAQFYKLVGGSASTFSSSAAQAWVNGDVVKVTVNSSNQYEAFRNGVSFLGPVTHNTGNTGTYHGFGVYANAMIRIEDFSITAAGGGPTTYTLTADSAAYTISGTAASLEYNRKLAAASATYTVTGTAASLEVTRRLVAESASYVITGTAATLLKLGSYSLSCDPAAYTVTGTAATFRRSLRFSAESGTYTISGTAASLVRLLRLTASGGSYSISGSDATLTFTPATPDLTVTRGVTSIPDEGSDAIGSLAVGGTLDLTYTFQNTGGGTVTLLGRNYESDAVASLTEITAPSDTSLTASESTALGVRLAALTEGSFSLTVQALHRYNGGLLRTYNWEVTGTVSVTALAPSRGRIFGLDTRRRDLMGLDTRRRPLIGT